MSCNHVVVPTCWPIQTVAVASVIMHEIYKRMPMLVCVAVRAKTILVLRMPGFSREIELAHLDID
jgi:hypothetical protein